MNIHTYLTGKIQLLSYLIMLKPVDSAILDIEEYDKYHTSEIIMGEAF